MGYRQGWVEGRQSDAGGVDRFGVLNVHERIKASPSGRSQGEACGAAKRQARPSALEADHERGARGGEAEGQEEKDAEAVQDAFQAKAGLAGDRLGLLSGHGVILLSSSEAAPVAKLYLDDA
jgi:hypothetical protein